MTWKTPRRESDGTQAEGANPGPGASAPLQESPGRGSNLAKPWAALALLAIGLVALFFALNFVVTHPRGTLDFAQFYTGATILRQESARPLYDIDLQRQVQRQFVPGGEFLACDHPPFEIVLLSPLSFLSYRWAFLAWAALNLLLLAGLFALIRRTGYQLDHGSRLVWLAVCLPLVAGNLVLGQDGLLLALVFLLGLLAMKQRREFAGGLLLGMGLFRFEILLPFAFILFLRRRWKFLFGFAVAGGVELLVSWLMIGWSGMVGYAHIILKAGQVGGNAMSADVGAMPSLRGALVSLFGNLIPAHLMFVIVLAGTLALLGAAAWAFRSLDRPADPAFDLQFSLAVVAALLSSYHLFSEVCTPLIVAAFLVLGYEGIANKAESLADRKGSLLFLLFALVLIVGGAFGFREFSVLFVVLLGIWAWLTKEAAGFRSRSEA